MSPWRMIAAKKGNSVFAQNRIKTKVMMEFLFLSQLGISKYQYIL